MKTLERRVRLEAEIGRLAFILAYKFQPTDAEGIALVKAAKVLIDNKSMIEWATLEAVCEAGGEADEIED